MTAPRRGIGGCPGCGAPLSFSGTGAPSCPACRLPLVGPVAAELGDLDRRLVALDAERGGLLTRRDELLRMLRAAAPPAPSPAPAPVLAPGPVPPPSPVAPVAARETSGHTVQTVLLALGGLLLAVAATVFTAVAWGRVGIGGRAVILAAITAAVLATPRVLARRDLRATAETLALLGIALLLVDGYAAWFVGLFRLDGGVYTGLVAATAAAVAAAYPAVVPVRWTRPVAVGLAQPVPALLATALDPGPTGWALVAALTVAADLALRTRARSPRLLVPATVGAGVAWATGTVLALTELGSVAAGAVLVLLAGLGVVATAGFARQVAAGWAAVAVALAVAGVGFEVAPDSAATLLAAVALAVAATAVALPRSWRAGPSAGALLVVLGAAAVPVAALATAAVVPLSWLTEPWSAGGGSSRTLLGPTVAWSLDARPLAAFVLVAGAAAVLAWRRGGLRRVAVVTAPGTVVLGVLTLDLPWAAALAVEAVAAAAAVAASRRYGPPVYVAGVLLAVHATVWSTAGQTATLVALGLLAAGGALAAWRAPLGAVSTALALLALTAEAGAAGVAAGLPAGARGALVTAAALPALAVCRLATRESRLALAAAWTVPVTALTAAVLAGGSRPVTAVAGLLVTVAAALVPRGREVLAAVAVAAVGAGALTVAVHPADALTPVTLLVTAVSTGVLGIALGGRRWAVPAALPVAAVAAGTVPAGLGWGWWATLAGVTALAVAGGVVAATVRPRTTPDRVLVAGASAVAAVAGAVALLRSLDRASAALAVVTVALAVAAALAWRGRTRTGRLVATGVAVAALHGVAAATGAVAGLPVHWWSVLVLGAAAVTALGRARLYQVGAAAGGIVALLLTAGHPWHLGLVLALGGAVLGALALRHRVLAVAAVVAELAASWAWLAAAEIRTPEAYTLPAALLTLAAGAAALRGRSSWVALAPGLTAALLPSLVMTFVSDGVVRRLLLGAAALVVVLAGGATRRQAPFALGAGVLTVVALRELGPVVADAWGAVPSWVPLSLGGVLLVVVGATYEQRRRDARRLRDAVVRMN